MVRRRVRPDRHDDGLDRLRSPAARPPRASRAAHRPDPCHARRGRRQQRPSQQRRPRGGLPVALCRGGRGHHRRSAGRDHHPLPRRASHRRLHRLPDRVGCPPRLERVHRGQRYPPGHQRRPDHRASPALGGVAPRIPQRHHHLPRRRHPPARPAPPERRAARPDTPTRSRPPQHRGHRTARGRRLHRRGRHRHRVGHPLCRPQRRHLDNPRRQGPPPPTSPPRGVCPIPTRSACGTCSMPTKPLRTSTR